MYKQSDANAVKVSEQVLDEVDKLQKRVCSKELKLAITGYIWFYIESRRGR